MTKTMRAKMAVNSVQSFVGHEQLHLTAVCADSYKGDGLDENNTYAKYTPSADLVMTVSNPALIGAIKPGEEYYLSFINAAQVQPLTSSQPLTLSLSSDTVLFLFKASWPLVAKAIEESLEAIVTEENLIKAQEQLREAVAWMTDKIPGDFDDILVGKVEELFTADFIAKYGDMVLDPLETFITASENKYDDLLLPAIAQLRLVANIPDNDEI